MDQSHDPPITLILNIGNCFVVFCHGNQNRHELVQSVQFWAPRCVIEFSSRQPFVRTRRYRNLVRISKQDHLPFCYTLPLRKRKIAVESFSPLGGASCRSARVLVRIRPFSKTKTRRNLRKPRPIWTPPNTENVPLEKILNVALFKAKIVTVIPTLFEIRTDFFPKNVTNLGKSKSTSSDTDLCSLELGGPIFHFCTVFLFFPVFWENVIKRFFTGPFRGAFGDVDIVSPRVRITPPKNTKSEFSF